VLAYDVRLEALRLLVDRRDELSKARVQAANGSADQRGNMGPDRWDDGA
jgi:hypothetical protein